MLRITNFSELSPQEQTEILARPVNAAKANQTRVAELIECVKTQGDRGIFKLTREIDQVDLEELKVSSQEIEIALDAIPTKLRDALVLAAENISTYHQHQRQTQTPVQTAPGVTCQRLTRPIERVGLYVPAGSAPLPSTVLMLAIPARIAGCETVIACTPPRPDGRADPTVLAAGHLCGINRFYKIGGVQAVAAMAYGTECVPKVDKIFGPGNSWVTTAKQTVATDPLGAACDLPAGPSELLVIADASANPDFVASDLLSQAEHGPDSQVFLVTPDTGLASKVLEAIERQLNSLPRSVIAAQALGNGHVLVVSDLSEAFALSNRYGPEHLILNIMTPRDWLGAVKNAGSMFLGPWAPESIGDYCSGTNHVLPTYGHSKSYSGLSLDDFQKQISVQELTPDGLSNIGWAAETIAKAEGLEAHARAVSLRLKSIGIES